MPPTPQHLGSGRTGDKQPSSAKRHNTHQTSDNLSPSTSRKRPSSDSRCKTSGCSFEGPAVFFADNTTDDRYEHCVSCRAFTHALGRYESSYSEDADLDHPTLLQYMKEWLTTWSKSHNVHSNQQTREYEIAEFAESKLESEFHPTAPRLTPRATRLGSLSQFPLTASEPVPGSSRSLPQKRASIGTMMSVDDGEGETDRTRSNDTDPWGPDTRPRQHSVSPQTGSSKPRQEQVQYRVRACSDPENIRTLAKVLHEVATVFDNLSARPSEGRRYVMSLMGSGRNEE